MALTQKSLDLMYNPPPDDGSVSVSVINAHAASKAERDELVKAAGTSRKTYRCVVWAARVINHEDLQELESVFRNVELQQLTPIRVLHRRTSAVRALAMCFPAHLLLLPGLPAYHNLLFFSAKKTHCALDQVFDCE
jgi:hypothetical protein